VKRNQRNVIVLKKHFIALLLAATFIIIPFSCAHAAQGQDWITEAQHVDIMLIAAHPDDEQLFLGAIIPTYVQQGRTAVTVIISNGYNAMRKNAAVIRPQEARDGLWAVGERQEPVIGTFEDHRFHTMKNAMMCWPEDKVVPFLVEQIRKYTPAVIVSQDVNGEYGHIAHKLMVQYVRKAFELSGDSSYCPETAKQYGVWNPLKLFLHLYDKNKIVLDTGVPLSAFGGKTAFQMAQLGFSYHKSQIKSNHYSVSEKKYSIKEFGLAISKVGYSVTANNLFESINLRTMLEVNSDLEKVSKTREYRLYVDAHGIPNELIREILSECGMPAR
jgi:LmbE family N-acetylglucosaminyl deacetylase